MLTATASGIATVAALATPAQAAASSAVCTLDGLVTTNPGTKLVGGSGSYSFSTGIGSSMLGFDCVLQSTTGVDVEALQFTSDGIYETAVCGSGAMESVDTNGGTISDPITRLGGTEDRRDDWWQGNVSHTLANQMDLSYHIFYIGGGQGVLSFTTQPGNGGSVQMTPVTGEQTTSACATHFQLRGVLHLSVPAP